MSLSRPAPRSEREPQGIWSTSINEPPNGHCLVLIKPSNDGTFSKTSPFAIKKELDRLVGTLPSVKIIRSGAILIECGHRGQTMKLLEIEEFTGRPVSTCVAGRLNTTPGVIHAPELGEHSEAELLELLEPQDVVHVQRCRGREGKGPSALIRITFRGQALPTHLFAGYTRIPVRPWINPPSRCQRCCQYGHRQNSCRAHHPTCGVCAGPHPTEGCEAAPSCPACGGDHPVWHRSCSAWRHAREEQEDRYWRRHFRTSGTTFLTEQWPSLEEAHRAPARGAPQRKTNQQIRPNTREELHALPTPAPASATGHITEHATPSNPGQSGSEPVPQSRDDESAHSQPQDDTITDDTQASDQLVTPTQPNTDRPRSTAEPEEEDETTGEAPRHAPPAQPDDAFRTTRSRALREGTDNRPC